MTREEELEVEEWIVLRDGATWTDRLKSEAECIFHIEESLEEEEVYSEVDYTYRKMTKKEIKKYN